jgi:choline dehydrogenase-like flavoprotein
MMSQVVEYLPEEERLALFLKRFGQVLILLALFSFFYVIFKDPVTPPFLSMPFLINNTIAGLVLVSLLAWFSKADVRRFRPIIYVIVFSMLIGAGASLVLYFSPITQPSVLAASFFLCLAAAITLLVLLRMVKGQPEVWRPWVPDRPYIRWEKITSVLFGILGTITLAAALGSILVPFFNPEYAQQYLISPLMIAGSSIKLGVLGILGLLVAKDVRRFTHSIQAITLQINGNAVSLIVIIALMLSGLDRFGVPFIELGGRTIVIQWVMLSAGLLDLVVVIGFVLLNRQINRLFKDDLQFLNLYQFRALEAIAETLINGGEAEILRPHEIALRTDKYLRAFDSARLNMAKWAVTGMQLWPLLYLQPPMTFLNPAARQNYIDRRFKQEVINGSWLYRTFDRLVHQLTIFFLKIQRRSPDEVKGALSFTGLVEAMLRFNMQLTYMGYYSDENVWPKDENGQGLGYVPFSKRTKDFDVKPIRYAPPLAVHTPGVVESQNLDTIHDPDVVIIGSGAAGSVLAEQMLARGRRVSLLEKGKYVDPQQFNEDEINMLSKLYSDGALQIAQSMRFTILQGSCVGGTTVVNNAVCFDTPSEVLDLWNSKGPVLEVEAYRSAQAAVRKRMNIHKVTSNTRKPLVGGVLNHGDRVISAGIERYFDKKPSDFEFDVVEANITDCLGCGYCNIGCPYGRKLSMLDVVLPMAQEQYGPEQFQIFSEAQAVRLVEDNGKITQIDVTIRGKRPLRLVNPRTVIVSGGTIHSSWLLMQSGIGKGKLPVGRGLSFNMGSPLHALFDEELNSYDGLQIAHYLRINEQPGFIFETWFNPPVAQAMAMPGWLETHFHNMQNYNRMSGVGVLVGTGSTGFVVPALLTRGPDVVYTPSVDDLDKLTRALTIFGEIFFEAGAQEVYASTRSYHAYQNGKAVCSSKNELSKLRELVKDDRDILLGTGHPMGGNALAANPQDGVVGPDFRVFGYSNLYIADASIFPTATTVNPQLSVMTIAQYASQLIDC